MGIARRINHWRVTMRIASRWPHGVLSCAAVGFLAGVGAPAAAEEASRRQIEEVVVTAERRESTVQDTAISITAFTDQFIEDFGIRNQEDLQAYIPATTIDPYDVSVRGVGRIFRALGGDPGVATYFNGAYSEDFGIASTEGGLYDIERIEVLRGPQGTLYGRNGVGGAVNFITKKPTQEFQGEARVVAGDYGTFETYGVLSGPLVPDVLAARVVAIKRERDGVVKNIGVGPDIDSTGDENYALALQWTPTDALEFNIRGNERSSRRVMSSAQGAGAIVASRNGGRTDGRDNQVWGYRAVDPAVPCPSFSGRTAPVAGLGCAVPGRTIHTFTHNGVTRTGQFVVPGIDLPPTSTGVRPNWAFNADPSKLSQSMHGNGRSLPDLDGEDLRVWQSGENDEGFDQQAVYSDATWEVNDKLTLKYIGAYTDYIYDRTTDDDLTNNGRLDMQFYVNQENENFQHEVQAFIDFTENLSLTAGAFYYKNQIDQRLDFYSRNLPRYTEAANYAVAGTGTLQPFMVAHYSAKLASNGIAPSGAYTGTLPCDTVLPGTQYNDPSVKRVCIISGLWTGEPGGDFNRVQSGPNTPGTSFIWDTENRSEATAYYAQGEWQINELFAFTIGGRITTDDKEGEESLFLYTEQALPSATLFAYNVATGALNADGTPTAGGLNETIPIRFRGRPASQSIYREVGDDYDETTWRVNLDWTPNDNTLVYLSATTGYRAGGFNLGFFSVTPSYDSENILAYELGYKGQLLDGALQLNLATYLYEYEDIHAQFTVENPFLGGTNTSVRNVPEAQNYGVEGDVMWLATDELTLGAVFSYTKAEYQADIRDPNTGENGVVDINNPNAPPSLYTADQLRLSLDGLQMNRIPEYKFNIWGQYSWQLGNDNGGIDLLALYAWQDEMTWDESDSPLDTVPAFARVDVRVTWNNVDQRWMVAGFVNNVTDEIGIRNEDAGGEAEGFQRSITPTLPRIWGMEVRYRFGAI